jgi:hypothetical protein
VLPLRGTGTVENDDAAAAAAVAAAARNDVATHRAVENATATDENLAPADDKDVPTAVSASDGTASSPSSPASSMTAAKQQQLAASSLLSDEHIAVSGGTGETILNIVPVASSLNNHAGEALLDSLVHDNTGHVGASSDPSTTPHPVETTVSTTPTSKEAIAVLREQVATLRAAEAAARSERERRRQELDDTVHQPQLRLHICCETQLHVHREALRQHVGTVSENTGTGALAGRCHRVITAAGTGPPSRLEQSLDVSRPVLKIDLERLLS